MNPLNKIASFTALSLSLALAGAGCMAPTDPAADTDQDEIATVTDSQDAEQVGEAKEAWFPFFSHFFLPGACVDPDFGCLGIPAPFFNGCGFPIHRCLF